MQRYKVLLIDDQHLDLSLQTFINVAELEDIFIDSVAFHKEGIDILKKDVLHEYKAVVLDATGFKDESDVYKEVNNTGLRYSLNELKIMSEKYLLPWFIYTGAPRNINDQEFEEEIKLYQKDIKFGRANLIFYTKTLHEQQLFDDIKLSIDNNSDAQLLLKYSEIIKSLKILDLGHDIDQKVINMFRDLESSLDGEFIVDKYNPIRKILESIFKSLANLQIVDPALIQSGQITGVCKLLCNNNSDYANSKLPTLPLIQELLHRLLFLTQDSSHSMGDLKLRVNSFYKENKGEYLYKSSIYSLFEIILYFGDYVVKNPDVFQNRLRWEPIRTTKELVKESDSKELPFNTDMRKIKEVNQDIYTKVGTINAINEHYASFYCDRSIKEERIPISIVNKYSLKVGQRIVLSCHKKTVEKQWIIDAEVLFN